MPTHAQLLTRLRYKQLALLVALDRNRNLHRAAEAVHLAQPSATQIVHDLEQLLGFPIFERLPRGMSPTELGAEVIAFAKRALTDLQRFSEEVDQKRQGGFGVLRVGAILSAAPDIIARAVAEIKQRRPRLAITLFEETTEEIVSLLLEQKIDLAVGVFSSPFRHDEIDYELLGREVRHLVARKDHPLKRVPRLTLHMLEQCPWILQPLTSPVRQVVELEFAQAGMKTPTNIVECTSIFATLQLLERSDAVTFLPESVVRDHLSAGLLATLPINLGKRLPLPQFGILSKQGEPLGATAAEFIELLRRHAASAQKRLPRNERRTSRARGARRRIR